MKAVQYSVTPIPDDLRKFLIVISGHGDLSQFRFQMHTLDPKGPPSKEDPISRRTEYAHLTQSFFGDIYQYYPELVRLNGLGANIYFSPNTMVEGTARNTASVISGSMVWFEKDNGEEFDLGRPVSAVLSSSPGKIQVFIKTDRYELLSATQQAEQMGLLEAIAQRVGGDTRACLPTQLLRLPTFKNRKGKYAPDFPTVHLVSFDLTVLDSYAQLIRDFPPIPVAPTRSLLRIEDIKDPVFQVAARAPNGSPGSLIGKRRKSDPHHPWWDIVCPWQHLHSTVKAEDTGLAPAGTGQVDETGFKCYHESCKSRTIHDYKSFMGLDNIKVPEVKYAGPIKPLPVAVPRARHVFPMHTLPEAMQQAVQEVARARMVTPQMVAAAYLTLLGNAMRMAFKIYEKPDHTLFASCGFIMAMHPGEYKTGVLKPILRIHLDKWRVQWNKEWAIKYKTISVKNRRIDVAIKALEKELESVAMESNLANVLISKSALLEAQKTPEIAKEAPEPYLLKGTEQAMERNMFARDGHLCVITDEGRQIIDMLKGKFKDSASQVSSEGFLLAGLANGPHGDDTISRGHSFLPETSINMLCLAQVDSVLDLLDHSRLGASGLLGRIMFMFPESLVGTRFETENDLALQENRIQSMTNMFNACFQETAREIRLDDFAARVRRDFYNEVELAQGVGNNWEFDREIVNKVVSQAVRFAAMFCVADNYRNFPAENVPLLISAENMRNSIELMRYFTAVSLDAIKNTRNDLALEVANRILAFARKEPGVQYYTVAKLNSKIKGQHQSFIPAALTLLEEYNYCTTTTSNRAVRYHVRAY